MRCEDVRELLPEYSVGALKRKVARRIGNHLETCPDCRDELDALERAIKMVEELPMEMPPERIWRSIAVQIEAEPEVGKRPWRRWFSPKLIPAWAGLALIGLALGIYLGFLRNPQDEAQPIIPLELKQHVMAAWDAPFSDTAALALYLGE
jgi:predicted anti-sigma-YlaC factor YlaD